MDLLTSLDSVEVWLGPSDPSYGQIMSTHRTEPGRAGASVILSLVNLVTQRWQLKQSKNANYFRICNRIL